VHCECGEETSVAESWPDGQVECICGRVWDVIVTARLRERVGAVAAITFEQAGVA
jgi:hypothetical protein